MTTTTNTDNRPFKALTDAAAAAKKALGLKYRPSVIRNEAFAFSIADRCRGHAVMLGEGAYWIACLADAARLERAGYEFAPRG